MICGYPEAINTSVVVTNCGLSGTLGSTNMYKTSYQGLVTPIEQQTSCDRELLSELIDFPIDQQTSCVSELLSELIQSLIEQHTFCDRELPSELIDFPIDQKLLEIRSFYQSSLTPRSIKNLAIRSSDQSSLTPQSTNNQVVIGSSYQTSLTP